MITVKGQLITFERVSTNNPKVRISYTAIHIHDLDLVIMLDAKNKLKVAEGSFIPPKFTIIRLVEVPHDLARFANQYKEAQKAFNHLYPSYMNLFIISD